MESDTLLSHTKKKILVVDDSKDILELVSLILQNAGFNVCTYDNGLMVDKVVEKNSPDLILLDVSLPGKYGTEVCKELKTNYSIPIILFSAHARREDCYKECRAEAFIAKPFDIKDLVNTINHYLN